MAASRPPAIRSICVDDNAAAVIVRALTTPHPPPRYLVGRDALVASVAARLPFRILYRLTAARSR